MRERRMQGQVPQLYTLSVEEARALDLASIQAASGSVEQVASVEDSTIDGPDGLLPVRLYRPILDKPLPVLVYFFGGGWTLGNLDTSDAVCRTLANAGANYSCTRPP
jgi:acetyl esterase